MRIMLLDLVLASFLASFARADSDQKECKSAFGTTACGYSRVAAFGEVCTAAFGQVTCSD